MIVTCGSADKCAAARAIGAELAAQGLVKTDRRRNVVNDVALNLRQGEIVGLLGPNGAGKTTLIGQISGAIARDLAAMEGYELL